MKKSKVSVDQGKLRQRLGKSLPLSNKCQKTAIRCLCDSSRTINTREWTVIPETIRPAQRAHQPAGTAALYPQNSARHQVPLTLVHLTLKVKAWVAQSCPALCDPMDCSPLGSSVHGISQERILEWVAISFSRGSSWPRDWPCVSCIGRQVLYRWAPREAPHTNNWNMQITWNYRMRIN